MYITLESDYAVRIVECLAKSKTTKKDAKTISGETGVSLRFALKILRKLVAEKIIVSYKGNRGGYMLAKAPCDISLKDVIETVEGKYFFSRCLEAKENCGCSVTNCKVQRVYGEISDLVRLKMQEITFDKII